MEGLKTSFKEKFEFKILPSFWILAFIALLAKSGYLFGLYTISVLIHEFAHFFVAKKLNYDCQSIKLSAFGAVLYGDFDEIATDDGIKIALAGPLCNLVVFVCTLALWWVFPSTYVWSNYFASSNLSLALTNLLPCYPLDGGRIFVCAFQNKYGLSKALKWSRVASLVVGTCFFLTFVIALFCGQNLYSCGLFGFFVLISSNAETKKAVYMQRRHVGATSKNISKGVEKKCLVFDGESTLYQVLKKLKENYFYQIMVVLSEKSFFVLEQPQINYCLISCTLDTRLKDLIKYKV